MSGIATVTKGGRIFANGQLGCTGHPASPGWHIHMCRYKEIWCVSPYSLKNTEKISGDITEARYTRRTGQGCRNTATQQKISVSRNPQNDPLHDCQKQIP